MKISWDESKRLANHDRYRVIGMVGDQRVATIFKPLGSEAISIISLTREQEGKAPSMTKTKGYTDDDLSEVANNPEWTEHDLATAQPLEAFLPELAASIRRGRGPQKAPTKTKVNLRLDQGVIDHFKATGKGWQVRMGDALKKAAAL